MVQFRLERVKLVRVRLLAEDGGAVIVGKRLLDGLGVVLEIEDENIVLLRVRPVQAGERLHRFDAGEHLVHIHRVQQRLVVAGLELFGADEEAIRVFLNPVGDVVARKSVQLRLADLLALIFRLAGEGDDGLVGALDFREVVAEGEEILDRPLDAAGHHHRPRLTADLVLADHLFQEVIHHDLGLVADGLAMALHIAAQFLARLLHVELRVAFDGLGKPVIAFHRRVVLEHVEDEALLNRLLHGVAVKRAVLHLVARLVGDAENFQRLVLRRGGEGEVAGIGQQLSGFDDAVDLVLGGFVLLLRTVFGQRHAHRGGGAPALAGVRLVNDDGELLAPMLLADAVEHKGKGLHGGDDDLLAVACRNFASCSVFELPAPSFTAPMMLPTWAKPLIVSRICLSRRRRSVMTMIESKTSAPSLRRPIN